jgi:hypothetical protein
MVTKSEQLQVLLAMAETVGSASTRLAQAEHARACASSGDARRTQAALRQARKNLESAQERLAKMRALWWEQFTGETEAQATSSPRSMS